MKQSGLWVVGKTGSRRFPIWLAVSVILLALVVAGLAGTLITTPLNTHTVAANCTAYGSDAPVTLIVTDNGFTTVYKGGKAYRSPNGEWDARYTDTERIVAVHLSASLQVLPNTGTEQSSTGDGNAYPADVSVAFPQGKPC